MKSELNILFISFDADPPHMGGTATVVNVLAKAFQAKGHFVALGYFEDSNHPSEFFQYKIKLNIENKKEIEVFIAQHKFDIVYNTQAMNTDFLFLRSLFVENCKIISAYHNKPRLRYLSLESLMNIYHSSKNPLYKIYTLAKIPLLPIWKYKLQKEERVKFAKMVEHSDRVQLLSKKFYPTFFEILPKTPVSKLIAIGNPVVFENFYPHDKLVEKEKKVIVVCSVNYQKRPELMIKIWSEIEKDENFMEWSFDFIGGGDSFDRIIRMSEKLNLKRIKFLGYQQPETFYNKASIFMMTSRYEGWPMVLMEAMQMGVVPIVFNSFESLDEIVVDKKTGYIISNNDLKGFVNRMKWLMKNENIRYLVAKNAIKSCENFRIEKIYYKYLYIFKELLIEKEK
ncbi:glycosyltransferase involved in cell wall biosynthesis [Runella defluvii]|uniref:Glycosyltransferase involved in cell wall biosynthesis n=1 Tax=Runella defluvii TaxID=370973 RepID=A0A7W5ZMH5_9BACT|nr:glycosyltransferase [Runella defluvii]MBB3839604.1 glycosyltransferase involved in cell wall biosynthesis [Runella defluvii]